MSDKLTTFCNDMHEKLSALESRLDLLKLNSGMTCHHLRENLDDARDLGHEHRLSIAQSRARLERWHNEVQSESKELIEDWKVNHETAKLTERARRAEEHAEIAMQIAEASLVEAERMILEAISARLDENSISGDDLGDDLSLEVRQSILREPPDKSSEP